MPNVVIPEDRELLDAMIAYLEHASELYQPGPYWVQHTKRSSRQIRKYGVNDFRGRWRNSIGASFTDCAFVDHRRILPFGLATDIRLLVMKLLKFHKIFNNQVDLTFDYYQELMHVMALHLQNSEDFKRLVSQYKIPQDTTRGGCLATCPLNGGEVAILYLDKLYEHDIMAKYINYASATSFFEIGGGFGANVHLIIENYPNIRKIVYLDIPPNLYVGTQYLKSFFGESVVSYLQTKDKTSISFSNNNDLEILCIVPQQIEKLKLEVDIFHNAHSFVEMPKSVVQNYAKHIEKVLSDKAKVGLISYDCFDLGTTFHPDVLTSFFSRKFEKHAADCFIPSRRTKEQYFYVSR